VIVDHQLRKGFDIGAGGHCVRELAGVNIHLVGVDHDRHDLRVVDVLSVRTGAR